MYESTLRCTATSVTRVCRTPEARRSRAPIAKSTPTTAKARRNGLILPSLRNRSSPLPRPSQGNTMRFWGPRRTSSLHELIHLDHRHQDGDGDESHRPAENDDRDGLEQARERRHANLHVRLVRFRDVLEHGLELAGFFTDGDHVRHHRRERLAAFERFGDALTTA